MLKKIDLSKALLTTYYGNIFFALLCFLHFNYLFISFLISCSLLALAPLMRL